MNQPSGTGPLPAETVVVLSISPIAEDHIELERIFSRPEWSLFTEAKWTMHATGALESALAILRNNPAAIVLSECDLAPGTWRDVLAEISNLSDPPLLIVASRHADEQLWAEALNVGAYDVLAKPFDPEEAIRVLSLAWIHGNYREIRNRTTITMATAS